MENTGSETLPETFKPVSDPGEGLRQLGAALQTVTAGPELSPHRRASDASTDQGPISTADLISLTRKFAQENPLNPATALLTATADRLEETEHRRLDATLDELTKLDKMGALQARLEEDIRLKRHASIGYVDLDRFKSINDIIGHGYGNDYLRGVSKKLKDSVRDTDFVARVGGDEFVVVFYGNDDNPVPEAPLRRLNDFMSEDGATIQMGHIKILGHASIGFWQVDHNLTAVENIARAEENMRKAKKESGRDRANAAENIGMDAQPPRLEADPRLTL